jgi:hypothetical protein
MWIQFESIYTMDPGFARYREIIRRIKEGKFRLSESNKFKRKYENQSIVPDD